MKEQYAIVDIETTGGHANAHGITEIAIFIHDGEQIIDQYQTLVNPFQEIPIFIQGLTGITDEMVSKAPAFSEVAETIFKLLENRIFIAHNVNFDFSFVHHHLKKEGYHLQNKKLCTVRLARKVFPGLPSYSLGKLCRSLGITTQNRHRAAGDAFATTTLFKMMLDADEHLYIVEALKQKTKDAALPSFINRAEIENIPRQPGVYYFKNKKDKIIYVGKAKNLHQRILSHFSNNSPRKQKQEFLREIRKISHQVCGTELQALILENVEIKRLWPSQNKAAKSQEFSYGLHVYEDQRGYIRLGVGKKMKNFKPFCMFDSLLSGINQLNALCVEFNLCTKLCNLQKAKKSCLGVDEGICLGACDQMESADDYNLRVNEMLESLSAEKISYVIIDNGRNKLERSCILVDKGDFFGMGYLPQEMILENVASAKSFMTPYPSHRFIKKVVSDYAEQNPTKKIILSN